MGAQLAVVVSPEARSVRGRTGAGCEQDAALTMGRSNSALSNRRQTWVTGGA